jgi:hypothetical protein
MSVSVFSSVFISSPLQIAPASALKVLADNTLTVANSVLSSGTFDSTSYRTLKVFANYAAVGSALSEIRMRLDNDSNADHYKSRYSENNGADVTKSSTYWELSGTGANYGGQLEISISNSGTTLANATLVRDEDLRSDWIGRYVHSGSHTQVDLLTSAGQFPIGSRMLVLGV